MLELGVETEVCICSTQMWRPDWVIFRDAEIVAYSEKMTCIDCGARAFCPTACADES